jgi:pyruvate dehydrogenase E2 component (dihydrolipoamide acetyltransferase)
MPSLGADMVQGRIVEWRVQPGDRVRRGDIVVVVDTEKAAIEVEVFEDGVVEEILVPEGSRVPIGTVLARLRTDGAAPSAEPIPSPEPPPAAATLGAAPPEPAPSAPALEAAPVAPSVPAPAPPPTAPAAPVAAPAAAGEPGRVRASPAARALATELRIELASVVGTGPEGAVTRADVERHQAKVAAPPAPAVIPEAEGPRRPRVSPLAERVAEELGVDLQAVEGTGPGGAVTREDVERAAALLAAAGAAPAAAAEPAEVEQGVDRRLAMRQAIAAAVSRSKREIPHYYLSTRIDLSRALGWLEAENRKLPVAERLLPAALLLRAVVRALQEYPEFNGFWIDDAFQPGDGIHPGVAISLREGGLMAPAILSADRKSVGELMQALAGLVQRARSGGLRGSELTAPTITITNLGDRGVETVFGVIYPPQVAIVGFGRVVEQPWAEGGMLGIRPVVTATLAADHRASDGHRGGRFLSAIDRLLQAPEEL